MAEADQRDLLPRIAVPTLLIWGDRDARSPLSIARQFEQAIPASKLVVIPGAGHVSNLERPEPFNDAVREFCRAHGARGHRSGERRFRKRRLRGDEGPARRVQRA
jgi:pimeloyl-ACP methyl ester carboxylesterase